MPAHEEDSRFLLDWRALSPAQKTAFAIALEKFVQDLRRGAFRKGLRVKRVEGTSGVWEMTWANDGRAFFRYGPSIRRVDPHIIWLRIGSHDILKELS